MGAVSNREYYEKRARAERILAAAGSGIVARVHGELADRYERLLSDGDGDGDGQRAAGATDA